MQLSQSQGSPTGLSEASSPRYRAAVRGRHWQRASDAPSTDFVPPQGVYTGDAWHQIKWISCIVTSVRGRKSSDCKSWLGHASMYRLIAGSHSWKDNFQYSNVVKQWRRDPAHACHHVHLLATHEVIYPTFHEQQQFFFGSQGFQGFGVLGSL